MPLWPGRARDWVVVEARWGIGGLGRGGSMGGAEVRLMGLRVGRWQGPHEIQ